MRRRLSDKEYAEWLHKIAVEERDAWSEKRKRPSFISFAAFGLLLILFILSFIT